MTVALATHFPPDPEAPRGGVEAVSVNLAGALAACPNLEVHVVTCDAARCASEHSLWGKVQLHRLPLPAGSTLGVATGAGRRLVSNFLRKLAPDVVHAHDTYGLMVQGLEIPRVFTIHGFIYGDTLVSGEKFARFRSLVWKWFETKGWAEQPRVISISPYVRERLAGISTGVIYDIDNPISEECFGVSRNEKRGVIFSAAVICPRKNPIKLVEAVGRLREMGVDAELRLAGHVTEPRYGEALERRIRELGIADRVVLLGRVSSIQVLEELSQASVFALVSLEENSPMGIEESMAVGVPVVTSNRCGMPYMVRHGDSGLLVNPLDPADIARALRRILENDELRGSMGAVSRAIALDRFHPTAVARRTRDVYEEACSSSVSS